MGSFEVHLYTILATDQFNAFTETLGGMVLLYDP